MNRHDIISHTQKLQSLGQLAGGVAHDFNNILSIIEGYTRILQRTLGHDDAAQEKLKHILLTTKRGAGLTRRLLAFGRQNINDDSVYDITQAIRENELLLKPLLTARIQLHISMPDTPLHVACNSDTLSQILINLAINARDAIAENGNVWINITAQDADKVVLTVTDNGCGIDQMDINRIFEPFYTTKPPHQGTGLGLSMIYGMMQQMGGTIQVESKPGFGTKFILTFPRRALPAKNIGKQDATAANVLDAKTILIVDDEEQLLSILEGELDELGLTVLKAANAESALILQENYGERIDLLLTDIVMPGINGPKLAELFTSLRPETGVVFMSGYPTRGDAANKESPLPQGALILPKPFSPDQLSPTLEKALRAIQTTGAYNT